VYLMADFREQSKLEAAILALKAAGIDADDMDVFSEEPVEFRRGILDRPSRMSLVAVLGAITTGGLATAGVYAAQHNYRLITGGMPVFWGLCWPPLAGFSGKAASSASATTTFPCRPCCRASCACGSAAPIRM
jgi:Alternative complex III, ActD subunit